MSDNYLSGFRKLFKPLFPFFLQKKIEEPQKFSNTNEISSAHAPLVGKKKMTLYNGSNVLKTKKSQVLQKKTKLSIKRKFNVI